MSHPYVVTECYADKLLVEFLEFRTIPRHNGNGEVLNTVLKKNIRVGLIDRFKRQFFL